MSPTIVHRGSVFSVEEVRQTGRAGAEIVRHIVRHPGAVVVVPLLADGRLVTIRNFRVSVQEWLEEFCAGKLEPGEDPAAAAARELIEETGYRAERIEPLGWFYTSPGFADERMYAFAAFELSEAGRRLEDDERIEVELRAPEEFQRRIAAGQVRDGKSISAFYLWQQFRATLTPSHGTG